jgi:hypothetical protein
LSRRRAIKLFKLCLKLFSHNGYLFLELPRENKTLLTSMGLLAIIKNKGGMFKHMLREFIFIKW